MTPDEKAELRKVAEAPQAGVIYRTIGADLAMMVRCKHVLALLDENARLAAEVEGLQKWIPCSERMPRDGYRVLGSYQSFGGPRVVPVVHDGSEDERLRWTADGGTQYGAGIITHWMPLPEPPK